MAAVAESGIESGDHLCAVVLLSSAEEQREELEYGRDVTKLVERLNKLNPYAKEFVPATYSPDAPGFFASSDRRSDLFPTNVGCGNKVAATGDGLSVGNQQHPRRKANYNQGRKKSNGGIMGHLKQDCIRRTIYVSDVDQHVTEEQLAAVFSSCGKVSLNVVQYHQEWLHASDNLVGRIDVLDCRVCGDPHSILRFAFVEFANESSARAALSLDGNVLGFFPVKVLPSRTAIFPVNPAFLPQSEDEQEMCSKTVYCTNIDKKVTQAELIDFFESSCGEVSHLRLLLDHSHTTHIAFVEFFQAESALVALNCSGMALGENLIRVSPSKTPVRLHIPSTTTMQSP